MSLPNLGLLSLRKLAQLVDDTAPKVKEKNAKKGQPSSAPYVIIAMKELDTDTKEPVSIVTAKNTGKATQAESAWLRKTYGPRWFEASQKEKMIEQARKALSYEFAPLILKALEDVLTDTTAKFRQENYNDQGAPMLDWTNEVKPWLEKTYPPNWRKENGSWLSPSATKARAEDAKKELRAEKLKQLEKQLEELVEQKKQEMHSRMIEELNFPDVALKRKGRALCRHWFNRKGKDGTLRKWFSDDYNTTDVPKETGNARLKWAKTQVGLPSYDPTNPPRPPMKWEGVDLYLPLDTKPIEESYLPDGVDAVSAEGGQWLWKFMRELEAMNIEQTQNYQGQFVDIEQSAKYWEPPFREKQKQMLKVSYQEFIESVNEMSEIPNAKDVAYSYTLGSGKFNKYLLWPSSNVGGDPTKIPTYGSGAGGVAGSTLSGAIGPPDALHRLYKLINRCPRLDQPAVFLRSVKQTLDLPHNLGKAKSAEPVIGRGYLNVTFMSTSSATPEQYTTGMLKTFYDTTSSCCMYAITAPAGSPVLPFQVRGTPVPVLLAVLTLQTLLLSSIQSG